MKNFISIFSSTKGITYERKIVLQGKISSAFRHCKDPLEIFTIFTKDSENEKTQCKICNYVFEFKGITFVHKISQKESYQCWQHSRKFLWILSFQKKIFLISLSQSIQLYKDLFVLLLFIITSIKSPHKTLKRYNAGHIIQPYLY